MVKVNTGYAPHQHQSDIHRRMMAHRFAVLVCHRRFGKTVLAINSLIDAALRFEGGDGRLAYVAPYLKQAKQIAWDYLKKYTNMLPGVLYNESELYAGLPNGARIRLYGADNADAMRGLYFDGVVMDEVADMKPYVWPEIIRPTLADRKGWCLFIGTPRGANVFFDLYQHALNDPDWLAGLYRAHETNLPWLDADELDSARTTMSENQYRQEFLCDFTASMDNVLITIDLLIEAAGKHHTKADLAGSARVLGVDVARFGDDRSVIQRRQGLAALEPMVFQNLNNMDLAARVAFEINNWKPSAVFVDAGRGEGVIDRLRMLGHDVIEVNFGARPINPRYANKRSEMWDSVREWLTQGGAIPNDKELKTDLCVPTYSFNAAGKMLLEPKEKIKERGAKSPDLGDALALTFALPVAPLPSYSPYERAALSKATVLADYDPLEQL